MSTDTTADTNALARETEALEDHLDSVLLKLARIEQANDEAVPIAIVQRLWDGEVPITVWRAHRGLTREQLAEAARVPAEVVAAVENGKEDVPLRVMQALARALDVELDDLVPWPDDSEVDAIRGG